MKRLLLFTFFIGLSLFTQAIAQHVPDTGQTNCYDNSGSIITCPSPGQRFYGQDANYIINPKSYTKLGFNGVELSEDALHVDDDGPWIMTRDDVTGLMWEVKRKKDGIQNYDDLHDADNTYTWYNPNDLDNPGLPGDGTDTQDFISGLNISKFGGFSDWRLPTIKELSSLLDHDIPIPGPTIDNRFFPNTASSSFWSSTTNARYTDGAWIGSFVYSRPGTYGKRNPRYARAVRGRQSVAHYIDNGDETVTDLSTGLMWQKAASPDMMSWEKALTRCERSTFGGYTDWRLPTINELQSLVDYSLSGPSINTTYFPDRSSWSYWSSTTAAHAYYTTDTAKGVYFHYGHTISLLKINRTYVRCVRSVQMDYLNTW